MTTRRLVITGWMLVGFSVACLIALQMMVAHGIGQWDAWQLAVLLHGAMLSGVFAHGLCWRRGSASLRSAAQVMAVVTAVGWLYTWFEPLRDLVAWFRIAAYGWLGP